MILVGVPVLSVDSLIKSPEDDCQGGVLQRSCNAEVLAAKGVEISAYEVYLEMSKFLGSLRMTLCYWNTFLVPNRLTAERGELGP